MKFLNPFVRTMLLLGGLAGFTLAGSVRLKAAPDENPLPVGIFKNLQEGKKQTVLLYGTSLTDIGAWRKDLADWFEKEFPGQITCVNTAKVGMHSGWGVENFQERVLAHNPDLVFIEFSANDASTKNRIPLEQSKANLDSMVKALRTQNPRVDIVLQTMNPAWDSPKRPDKKFGSDRPQLEAYYDVYRRYARAQGLPLVDNYPVWRKLQQQEPEKFKEAISDGIHPDSGPSLEITGKAVKALMEEARQAAGAAKPTTADQPVDAPHPSDQTLPSLPPAAAPSATINLWPEGRMPGKGSSEPETVRFPEKKDALRLTHVSTPTLAVYPASRKGSPAMIICPGGGYNHVVMDKEGTEIAAWLNSKGIGALVLKYRVPRNREGALQDLQRALRLTRIHGDEWNIDTKKLGALGFSAGGNLVAKASAPLDSASYAPVDAIDEQSCRPDFAILVYPAYLDDGKDSLSPELNLHADIPPTVIVHTEDDRGYVKGSKLYHAALDQAKIPHRFLLYSTGGHGYGMRSSGQVKTWPDDVLESLLQLGVLPAQENKKSETSD